MHRWIRILWCCFAAFLCLTDAAGAVLRPGTYEPGEVLVRFRAGASMAKQAGLREALDARVIESFAPIGVQRLRLGSVGLEETLARLAADPDVMYAEPNYLCSTGARPNDPLYPQMWQLRNVAQTGGTPGADIHAEPAWDLFTGAADMLVGVIDTGVDYGHPDLAANIWTNPGEIAGNGIDDDGNGYVDDVHGYDFANRDPDPMDDNGHGTHVAGTIAAVGNNGKGTTGINWHARIVALKFLRSNGSGNTADALAAILYATRMGIRVLNNSWGSGIYSQALYDAIAASGEAGAVFVAAAGNSGLDADIHPMFPAAFDLASIISVAATDRDDQLAAFSNFGALSVDVAAPGAAILSLWPGGGVATLSGTSMATPHVAGACALLLGRFPDMGPAQVKDRILGQAQPLAALSGRCVSGARLDLHLAIADPDTTRPGGVTDLHVTAPGSSTMDLAWTASGDDGATGTATRYELRVSSAPLDSVTFADAPLVTVQEPSVSGSAESASVHGLATNTTYWFGLRVRDEFGNAGPISNIAVGTTLGPPHMVITPLTVSGELRTGETLEQEIVIHNDSQGTLDWHVPTPLLVTGSATAAWPEQALAKGEDGAPFAPQSLTEGGPDAFGYRWLDSSEPRGPGYQWVDIEQPGNQIDLSGDDALSANLPLGFSFPFYGKRYTSVHACTNGFLSFAEEPVPFVNAGLPSSRGVHTMIAPFWDDLNFGAGVNRAYAHADGARFVVTWAGVPRYADPGSVHTFQAILYPSGEIRFQYRQLTGVHNNCTVGIQDTTRTVGLTVAFNQDYLRDSLAVRIVPLRQWLTAEPDSGFLAPGASATLRVLMDAASLASADYAGEVHVHSNDPGAPDVPIAALLHVDGAPDAAYGPVALDFGSAYVGVRETLTVTVANVGVDSLRLLWVSAEAPFAAVFAPGSLAPGDARVIPVIFAPTAPGSFAQAFDIACDDPDLGLLRVEMTAVSTEPPRIECVPRSFSATAANGVSTRARDRTTLLRVRNTGVAPLHWTLSTRQVVLGGGAFAPGAAAAARMAGGPALKGAQEDAGMLGSGGPDAGGYRWTDSDAPGGPPFEWEEISGVGTRLFGSTDDSTRCDISLPFAFPFYGGTYSSVNVCTNGWLSFSDRSSAFRNSPLPDTSAGTPRNLVAPWWDDLDLRASTGPGAAYAYFDGTRFIIEWRDCVHFATGGPYTFQVLLWPNGTIDYQYLSMSGVRNQATIGMQDAAGTSGTLVTWNAAYVHDRLRVRLGRLPDWLTVDRTSGVTAAGAEDTVRVQMSARGYDDGDQTGELELRSDDVAEPLVRMRCDLRVSSTPVGLGAMPRVIGSLARTPFLSLEAECPWSPDAIMPGSARLADVLQLAAPPVATTPGRLAFPFAALDVVALLPPGEGERNFDFAAEVRGETWIHDSVRVSVRRPPMSVVGLPPYGDPGPELQAASGEVLPLAMLPPALVDRYEVWFSPDRGAHWLLQGQTIAPAWAFRPELAGSGALVEVLALHADSLTGVWLSAPFAVAGQPSTGADGEHAVARFDLRVLGAPATRGQARFVLELPLAAEAHVELFDLRGARVRVLQAARLPAGRHELQWDGRDGGGTPQSPGVYFIRARAGRESTTRRIVLAR